MKTRSNTSGKQRSSGKHSQRTTGGGHQAATGTGDMTNTTALQAASSGGGATHEPIGPGEPGGH